MGEEERDMTEEGSEIQELRRRLSSTDDGVRRQARDMQRLTRRIEGLEARLSAILDSRRWKALDLAGTLGRKASSRPRASAAASQVKRAVRRLRDRKEGEPGSAAGADGGARRLGPRDGRGIKKVQVGCGPHNLMDDWWNVDINEFPGIDEVMDATKPWPYENLEYVFGEHFLEHLTLDGSVQFLSHAGNSLRTGGVMRISTPNLKYVLQTHYVPEETDHLVSTLRMNRAFHGWGHRFLYTEEMLAHILAEMGFEEVSFFSYGESNVPALSNLERHGKYRVHEGEPSVIIAEARKGDFRISPSPELASLLNKEFLRYLGVRLKS
ncbi:MAG: hypothetical protein M3494_15405 [Actinomycetota bacterium]|jgi:predicted SAM-dependent methyltransferase|nr:hypothetical protein [Actinomycetota bacterium]